MLAELERSKGGRLPDGGKSKAEQLADVGISTSTANRYEALAGGKTEEGRAAAAVKLDFAETRAAGVPSDSGGILVYRGDAQISRSAIALVLVTVSEFVSSNPLSFLIVFPRPPFSGSG